MKGKYFSLGFYFLLLFFALCTILIAQNISTNQDTVYVEIQDQQITSENLRMKISSLPSSHRARYQSIEGQKTILNLMITEEVFLKRARELGIDQEEDVRKEIHEELRNIINELYLNELVEKNVLKDPKEVEKYYLENQHLYIIPARITIQHLQVKQNDLEVVQNQMTDQTDFLELIEKYSQNEQSKSNKGLIRNIRGNKFIPGIGNDDELDRAIYEAENDPNIIHGPVETTTGIHFFKKLEHELPVQKEFSEVRTEIEAKIFNTKELDYYTKLSTELNKRYNIIYLYDVIDGLTISKIQPDNYQTIIVTSTHPDIVVNIGDYINILRKAEQERIDTSNTSMRHQLLKSEVDSRAIYAAALDAKMLEKYKNNYQVQQTIINTILMNFTIQEINSQIKITDEELLEYYYENTQHYTNPAHRNIRQFIASNEKNAKTHRKTMNKIIKKKNNNEEMINFIQKESLDKASNGSINYVYNNGIIPGIGEDRFYNDEVFKTKIGTISKIIKNSKGEYVFFHVIEEIPPSVRSLPEVETSLRSNLFRQKSQTILDEMKEELIQKYNVITHFDLIKSAITPAQLFDLAETAQNSNRFSEAIRYYDQIIQDFNPSDDATRALFMKAFIVSETQNDPTLAIELFEEFLKLEPNGELSESVRYLLEALKSGKDLNLPFQD